MELMQAIKYGIPDMLRVNEHQILFEIELRLSDCSIEHEDYITFWIASHKHHETAADMFEVFMNTVQTAFTLVKSEEIMELYSLAALVGAIGSQNIDILEYIKGYHTKEDIHEELCAQCGDEAEWPPSLLEWYNRNFS